MDDYYMNAPPGYPFADQVRRGDQPQILRFLLMLVGEDKELGIVVRDATHEQRITMLEESGFTFDPEWRAAEAIPPSEMKSALDDPNYRWSKGIGKSL